ncbi:MAG TPA: diacylglycerol kinase family lipid kinase [Firmicutes bacterium]|nr:diacylglycerol kinase family lipid kinase [Bacillota bacterium]
MKVLFLINPEAGKSGNANAVATVTGIFMDGGWDVTRVMSESAKQASELIENALTEGFELLVLGGGDGTIHHCIQHLPLGSRENPSQLPFAIIPFGSGNDFFRGIGAPLDIEKAARRIIEGKAHPVDIGVVEPVDNDGTPRDEKSVRFINTVGVGMDSQVLAFREKAPSWMSARYELIFLMTLAGLYPLEVSLKTDEWERDVDAYWILCCNNGFIGSGMKVAPDAKTDDGLFDILIIEKQSKLRFVFNLPKVFKGTHIHMDRVHILRAKNIFLKCNPVQRMAVDGDREFESPAKISILPGAVSIRS